MDFCTVKNLDTGEILSIADVNQTCFISETAEEALQQVQPLSPLDEMFIKVEEITKGDFRTKSTSEQKQSQNTIEDESGEEGLNLTQEEHAAQMLFPDQVFKNDVKYNWKIFFEYISGHATVTDKAGYSFVVYFLEVRGQDLSSPGSFAHNWRVYRRYQEFSQLNSLLRELGYNVPALPPKRLLKRMDETFLSNRQKNLENWLNQLLKLNDEDSNVKNPLNCLALRRFLLEKANEVPLSLTQKQRSPDQNLRRNKSLTDHNTFADLQKKKINLNDFELIRVIGRGSFGKVMLVKKKDSDHFFAMKTLNKQNIIQRRQVEHTQTERNVLGTIHHPFIVRLHFAFQTEKKLFFILDYCAGGELFFHLSRMKKFPEPMAQFYAAEITLALEHLHKNKIVYRDLKPENILLDEIGHIKLADFGLAKEGVCDPIKGASTLCGTPEYICPEILNRRGYGTAVDWWNLGMVFYEMLTGLPPWYTPDRRLLFDRIKNATLCIPFDVSINASSLIRGLLTRNPSERLGGRVGAAEIKAHLFFREIDWTALLYKKVKPPFNPCRKNEIGESSNFEKEFTQLRLHSDENSPIQNEQKEINNNDNNGNNSNSNSHIFDNFTYEQESELERVIGSPHLK